jgi:SLT domain-containing protein
MTTAAIVSLIETEARIAGLEPTWMVRIAEIESSLNPNAVNKQSGASGLYQIMPFHKVVNVLSAQVNVRWAMQFTKANHKHLRSNGVPVTLFTTYLAHQQGATGSVALLKAAADGKKIHELSSRLRKNIGANDASNAFKTVQQFLDFWEQRINRKSRDIDEPLFFT